MSLTPNNPKKRVAYVVKTYMDKYPRQVVDTIEVAIHGMELERNPEVAEAFQEVRLGVVASHDYSPAFGLDQLEALLPAHFPGDHIIPWVARELVRLFKAVGKHEATTGDYQVAYTTLFRRAPALFQWAAQYKGDVLKMSLAQVIEALKSYAAQAEALAKQGNVIYRFKDGWTAQELRSPEALEEEGEIMQHCVGGYCEPVRRFESFIISLRDAKGAPHVTIEYFLPPRQLGKYRETLSPRDQNTLRMKMEREGIMALVGTPLIRVGFITQVFGKQNDPPVEKYRPYVWELIAKVFDGDPMGMMLSYADSSAYSFEGRRICDYEFAGLGDYDVFKGVSFDGVEMDNVIIGEIDLSESTFFGATLNRVQFQRTNLDGVMFDKAKMSRCEFDRADIDRASFDEVTFDAVSFYGYRVDETYMAPSFKDAVFDDKTLDDLKSAFGESWMSETVGRIYNHRDGVWEVATWDPYAREYRPASEIEDEEEDTFDDDEPPGDDEESWSDP